MYGITGIDIDLAGVKLKELSHSTIMSIHGSVGKRGMADTISGYKVDSS